ncbi:ACT domain-containing protein [Methanobrevibacter sp. DSM 116169]|uniref:ACT domain-containing protein n=1 Tax=Methanobrevibacter sp. DSM 116169 TaxID=3242727 RepID=UPI0038FCBED1
MKVNQLSIFLENKKGKLYKALNVLSENNINIRALSLADTSEFGILRIVVDNPSKGEEILKKNNFVVKITKIIAIELDDTPGGLSSVLRVLDQNNINLEYLYAFTHERSEKAILLLHTDNIDNLINVLENNNVVMVSPEEIYDL